VPRHIAAFPRIAVLLCTADGADYLAEQLASIAAQSRPPVVVFIHDWNSRDRTRVLLAEFASLQSLSIPVTIVEHDNKPGAALSFIRAIKHCLAGDIEFDYLALCDQDDLWAPCKLRLYADRITEPGRITPEFLYGDVQIVGSDGKQIISPTFYGPQSPFRAPLELKDPSLLLVNPVVGMSICASRRFLESHSDVLEGPWLMHDWALALLASSSGTPTAFLKAPTVNYRQHGANVLGATQGWRLYERFRKARQQFTRLKRQAEWLERSAGRHTEFPAKVFDSRWSVAMIAVNSRLLKPIYRWLLACAILVLW